MLWSLGGFKVTQLDSGLGGCMQAKRLCPPSEETGLGGEGLAVRVVWPVWLKVNGGGELVQRG